jgi:hypothetical protein
VNTAPDVPFSLEFEPVPSPSIVSGDSLRNLEGVAQPLRARAYNIAGDLIPDVPVTFIVIDTSDALVLDPVTNVLTAMGSTRRGTARVVASIGSLQTTPQVIEIVPRPVSVARSGTIDTLRYSFSNPGLNRSGPLQVIVRRDSANAPVPAYLVRFRLETPADTIVARLVDDGGRRSNLDAAGMVHLDTTGSDGVASRRIQLTPGSTLETPLDSIVVLADVRLAGTHVTGSPVRLVLPVKPRGP